MTKADIIRKVKAGTLVGWKDFGLLEKSPAKPVRSNRGNVRCTVDGINFDSTKEANRYVDLKRLQDAGEISNLKVHTKWILVDNPELKYTLSYEDDFNYMEKGVLIVEDVKPWDKKKRGFLLPAKFKQKQRLMLAKYGIVIVLI